MVRLMRLLAPYRLLLAAVIALVLGQSLSDLYLPTLMADIIDNGVVHQDITYIVHTGGMMLLVAAGGMICALTSSFLSAVVSSAYGRDIRRVVFTRVESFSLREIDRFGTATLITRTTNDVTQVQMVTLVIMRMMISAPLMAIGGLIMALSQDRPLTLVLAVAVPILTLIIYLITRQTIPLFQQMQVKIDRLNLVLREGLMGIRVIRAFNRIDHEHQRFQSANEDLTSIAIRANRVMALAMPVLMFIMNVTSVAIIWFGAIRIDSGGMQIGSLIAFTQYAMQIMFSLLMVSMMLVMIPRAAASATRINAVIDTTADIVDPEVAESSTTLRGEVEFRDVSFTYPGAEQPAVQNISFAAHQGEVVAIIGGTGAGKSTLLNLVLRFYDVGSGAVLIDGVDVRQMTMADARRKLGYVPQKAVLFSGTVASNVRFGDQSADHLSITRATTTAQALDFISEMPDGFDARIAQGGTNVSGGQKQRLSIARALVRQPEIYLFDDSFSALDFKTDARLRQALRQETTESTVIVVAQRVATVMDADRIVVLDEGRIVGTGTHRELLKTCPVYREIVASQLAEEEIA